MDAKRIRNETMATLTIKNLPDEIYAALTRTAKRNRRSINNEAIVVLERSISQIDQDVEQTIQRLRELRAKNDSVWLTDKDINFAKNEGRP